MSTNQAILELVFKAQNLAEGATDELRADLDKVGSKASEIAGKVTGAFGRLGSGMKVALGQSVEQLVQGGDLGVVAASAGAMMAGELAQEFSGDLITKLAGSSVVAAIAGPLAALGGTIGTLISTAIPVGMAAAPAILIAALVAAVAVLIANPEIRGKVIAFVAGIAKTIGDMLGKLLGGLAAIVGAAFGAAWDFVVKGVLPFILELVKLWLSIPGRIIGLGAMILQTIIGGLIGLPGKIAGIIGDAFRSIHIDIGPFHISSSGVTIDLPKIPGFAGGVTGFAGGLARVGELGPEYVQLPAGSNVLPAGRTPPGGSSDGLRILGVSEADIIDMVDRGLFFKLQRAVPTVDRT